MSESLEQRALRIRQEMLNDYDWGCPLGSDRWHIEFARRLMAEQEPVSTRQAVENAIAASKNKESTWAELTSKEP